jgi:hypothetical protein
MASSALENGNRWPYYVASAFLRRIRPNTADYNPCKGDRIYRRYEYTIDLVGRLTEARRVS